MLVRIIAQLEASYSFVGLIKKALLPVVRLPGCFVAFLQISAEVCLRLCRFLYLCRCFLLWLGLPGRRFSLISNAREKLRSTLQLVFEVCKSFVLAYKTENVATLLARKAFPGKTVFDGESPILRALALCIRSLQ